MYCSNCGNQINVGLNYCNRCGVQISKTDSETNKSVTENFSTALGYIGAFGLIGFIFIILILVKKQVPEPTLVMISFFYLATLFGICFLIIQYVKNLSGKKKPEKTDVQDYSPPAKLSAKTTAQLEEHSEPAISVTEHTTRTLEKVPLREN